VLRGRVKRRKDKSKLSNNRKS